ncbi:hypothetical protein Q3G72_003366 [Acer saccharum]|nr:hypothetical protein Q3G72_003366 [Acer saccharum]
MLHPHRNTKARGRLSKLRQPIVFFVPLQPSVETPKHEERISYFDSEELEGESVDIQCGVNVEDEVDVEDGLNVDR